MVNKLIEIEIEADIFVQDLKMMTIRTDQLFTGSKDWKYRPEGHLVQIVTGR
jgi:hypothetical protein